MEPMAPGCGITKVCGMITPNGHTPSGIEVNEVEQYQNLATVSERNGRKAITLVIRTSLTGKALEVAIAEALNAATVIEFQISEIAQYQPWKIQLKHEALQPRRQTINVSTEAIEKAIHAKRKAAGDQVIG